MPLGISWDNLIPRTNPQIMETLPGQQTWLTSETCTTGESKALEKTLAESLIEMSMFIVSVRDLEFYQIESLMTSDCICNEIKTSTIKFFPPHASVLTENKLELFICLEHPRILWNSDAKNVVIICHLHQAICHSHHSHVIQQTISI